MNARQLGTIFIAAIVAFGAAFGVGKATSSSGASASPAANGTVKALELADAPSVGALTTGKVPAFKAAPKKKTTKKAATKPSTNTTPARTAVPQQTAVPQRTAVPQQTAKPAPTANKPKTGGGGGGVSGGGED